MPLNFFTPPRQAIGGHLPGLHLSHIPKTLEIPTRVGNMHKTRSQPSLLLCSGPGKGRELPGRRCSSRVQVSSRLPSLLNSTTCWLRSQEVRERPRMCQPYIRSVSEPQKRQRQGRTSHWPALSHLLHGPCILAPAPPPLIPPIIHSFMLIPP